MRELPNIPEIEKNGGPDILQQISYSFIYTAYPSPTGERFFITDSKLSSHMDLIDNNIEEILPALFGPKYEKIKNSSYWMNKSGLLPDAFDWHFEVRKLARDTNLYGRYAPEYYGVHRKFTNKPFQVIWLWLEVEDWQQKLKETIKRLKVLKGLVEENCLIGIGRQILGFASDFKKDYTSSEEEKERLHLLAKYHTATGEEKEALKKILFGNIIEPAKATIKRTIKQQTDPYFLSYSESILKFKEWFNAIRKK